MELKNYNKVIEQFAKNYIAKIKKLAPVDTGALHDSIKYIITEDGFEVDALPYLDYLDKGVEGAIVKNFTSIYSYTTKKPPIKKLKPWAKKRGINPWALQNSIYRKGIKPKKFLTKADSQININDLVTAYNKDIDNLFL